jgi:23S rRNA (guanosine2251-2'-O)-methyltransferase
MGGDCLVAADQITDPRNLGALIRSAEALGATGLLLPGHGTARITPVVEKAAAGATSFLPVANVGNLANALNRLKKSGYWVVGLAPEADRSIQDFEFPERVVLVVGSEGEGLRSRTRSLCDFILSIPLTGSVSSLNVSVAGAIAVFCFRANRRVIDTPNSA